MPGKPKVPGFVITAAVLLFIYGGMMLMCGACGALQIAVVQAQGPAANGPQLGDLFAQEHALAKRIPSYTAVEAGLHIFNLALGTTMIVSGLGALYLKKWARWGGTLASAADLFALVAHGPYVIFVIMPANEKILEEQMQGMAGAAQGMTWASLAFSVVLSLVLNVPILAFLNARSARDAFAGNFPPDPHEQFLARLDALADDDDYTRRRSQNSKPDDDTGITGKPQ